MKSWLDNTTRAGAYHGPMSECDACFETAWDAEWDAVSAEDYWLLPVDVIDARADQARANGHHPCSNHK